jgi:hypothetical protein
MSAVSWPEISEGVAVGGREFVWQSGGTLTVFRKNGGTLTGTQHTHSVCHPWLKPFVASG